MTALRLVGARGRMVRRRPAVLLGGLLARAGVLDAYAVWPARDAPVIAFHPGDAGSARSLPREFVPARPSSLVGRGLWQALRSRDLLVTASPPPAVALAERALERPLPGARVALIAPGGGVGKVTCILTSQGEERPVAVLKAMGAPTQWRRLRLEVSVLEALRARTAAAEAVVGALPAAPMFSGVVDGEYIVVEQFDPAQSSGERPTRDECLRWLAGLRSATRTAAEPWDERDEAQAVACVAETWALLRPEREQAVTAAVRGHLRPLRGLPMYSCAVHGDFWRGNLARAGADLRVFDWEWAQLEGSPVFDLWSFELCELRQTAQTRFDAIEPELRAAVGRVRGELTQAGIDGRFAAAMLAPTLAELVSRVRRALGVPGPWESQAGALLDGVERLLELPVAGRAGAPIGGRFVLDQTSSARSARVRDVARTVPGARSTYLAGHRVAAEARSLGYATRVRFRLWRRPEERERTSRQAPRATLALTVAVDDTAELLAEAARQRITAVDRGYGVYLDDSGWPALLDGADPARTPRGAAVLLVPAAADEAHARLLAGNLLHEHGVGPPVYDVAPVTVDEAEWTAYFVAPWPAAAAPPEVAAPVLQHVSELKRSHGLDAVATSWQRTDSVRAGGDPTQGVFVDFPNLRASEREALVRSVLSDDARSDLHYGREAATRGGRYLYQTVPLVGAVGRRDVGRRWERITGLLDGVAVSVRDRAVLDVGCNAGMMLAAALADGAAWGVGWDLPAVAQRARVLLWRLGYTRFDTVGAELAADYVLAQDVPAHVVPALPGSIVLYLAIRHHVGFLTSLATLPWEVLVYEGGETESAGRIDDALTDLAALCSFDVAAAIDFRDGEGAARPLAVLVRR